MITRAYLDDVRSSSSSMGGLVMPSGALTVPDTFQLSDQEMGRPAVRHSQLASINRTNSAAAPSTSSLTTTASNSDSAASSTRARSRRAAMTSGVSVPRA